MEKYNSCFVIAENKASMLELVAGAATYAENINIICLGEACSAKGVSAVYVLPEACSVAAYSAAIAELIKSAAPELVMLEQCRNGRLIAGIVAAALNAGVQTDPFELSESDGGLVTKRLCNGGFSVLAERSGHSAVLCIGSGFFDAAEEQAPVEPKTIDACSAGISLIEKKEKNVQRTNLSSARRIVGVGRGIKDAETLALIESFAQSIEAEIGCTRPVAEEDRLLPTSRYIGVSGVTVRPELYIAVGLSGQVQHTSGINQSGFILAINKDENAPIFKNCDLGIVGDLNTIIPKLSQALTSK